MTGNISYEVEEVQAKDRDKYSGKRDDYGNLYVERAISLELVDQEGNQITINLGEDIIESLRWMLKE